jgi:PAS domain S-box-containing protein
VITVEILDNIDLIDEACALLYTTYIEFGQWNFNPDNPSHIKIEVKDSRKLLVDRFTHLARWFGIFDDERLIGCFRLCGLDENNKFEIEGYPDSNVIHQYLTGPRQNFMEMSRITVADTSKASQALSQLYLSAFEYCQKNKFSVFGGLDLNNSAIKSLFTKVNLSAKVGQAFKYEASDPLPINFYMLNYAQNEYNKIIENLKISLELHLKPRPYSIMQALELVAPILPAPVYWHDREGAVLGLNDSCLKVMGALSREDIIGKTPYDFYPKKTADIIWNHSKKVILTGGTLSQEEEIHSITTGEYRACLAIKSPLYDENGNIVGIIGTSIDITAEKEAEQLRHENEQLKFANEKQKLAIELEGHKKFKQIVDQMAHDLGSPLMVLSILTEDLDSAVPENERLMLKEAARRIRGIAGSLLNQYKAEEPELIRLADLNELMVSTALEQLIIDKQYEYQNLPVNFDINYAANSHFSCIKTDILAFKRMLSNLINNAVDALDGKKGNVTLSLDSNPDYVQIRVSDNGRGMPQAVIDKISNNISITDGKENGYGIGFTQIHKTLEHSNGTLSIDSQANIGTTIVLTFPKTEAPKWVVEEIVLREDDLVIILDDDRGIHGAWDIKFGEILAANPKMQVKHFEIANDVINFISELSNAAKENIFLVTDYELLKQGQNGLDVVTITQLKRSILVTSHYNNPKIHRQALLTDTKILPKLLAPEIKIIVHQ